uniref:Uncharacterized protein n=1 Tax=Panagrolaimus sp. ES5 TaxID=591445 RepID=A0AC34FC88_9BILA
MAIIKTTFVYTTRALLKFLQAIAGFIICSSLCNSWHGGASCFFPGRLGYAAGLNFVVLIINSIIFNWNMCKEAFLKFERIYSIICTILFAIATGLLLWYMIQHENFHTTLVITAILLFVQTLLFLWDVKILQFKQSEDEEEIMNINV